jgi:RNA polymerase sigma-B factor
MEEPANGRVSPRDLVSEHMPIARSLARRFTRTGEPIEDLEQVAFLGLVLAAERFDPDRGVGFVAFAVPTVLGELKRHLRDCAWSAHVPRRIKELTHTLHTATAALMQRLGRSPSVAELAEEIGASEEDVLEAMEAGRSLWAESLDTPVHDDGDATRADVLGSSPDPGFGRVEEVVSVLPALSGLSPRKQEVLRLRYYEGLSQREIGERIGVSQVHVSRLIAQSLDQVRALIT